MDKEKEVIWSLRQWKRDGYPGQERPAVARGLASLDSAASREKAGHILRELPAGSPGLRVALTGSFNCAPLENLLRAALVAEGLDPAIHVSDFNQWVQDLGEPDGPLARFSPGVVFCLLDDRAVFDEVADPSSPAEVESAVLRKLGEVEALAERFAGHSRALLVLATVPLPADRMDNLVAYKSKAALGAAWRKLDAGLLALAAARPQVITLDTAPLLQRCEGGLGDPRLALGAGMSWGYGLLDAVAREGAKLCRAVAGKSRKCLVLDLDDTLWGGVLGDCGVAGVALGREGDGKPFLEFQKRIRLLKRQGVLLAVSSKNDRDKVLEMFRTHPDMQLRENDFVDISANWEPKPDAMRRLAEGLNIGLDSMVFLDDSRFEREFMRREVPEAAVPEMPADPALYVPFALAHGWFNTLQITGEDLQRTDQYLEQGRREGFRQAASSTEDFLRGLDLEVSLLEPSDFALPRMAQICQRTNQFNLTGRRYSLAELQAMREGDGHMLLGIGGRDRFGEYGMVGLVVVDKRPGPPGTGAPGGETWRIRNFLLSCRVFSRGIEEEILRYVLECARRNGAAGVVGEYSPTPKNGNYRDFYPRNGFRPLSEEGGVLTYHHALEDIMPGCDWITLRTPEREAA